MKNLLIETENILRANHKKPSDVIWVGNEQYKTTWDNFKLIADTVYDSSYGSPQVAEDLIIVGKDFWLERHEYDGSEWWEYKEMPKEPKETKEIKALTINQAEELGFDVSCGWEDLDAINGGWQDD